MERDFWDRLFLNYIKNHVKPYAEKGLLDLQIESPSRPVFSERYGLKGEIEDYDIANSMSLSELEAKLISLQEEYGKFAEPRKIAEFIYKKALDYCVREISRDINGPYPSLFLAYYSPWHAIIKPLLCMHKAKKFASQLGIKLKYTP